MRARVFVDFWNFQLGWNATASGAKCDWARLPRTLVSGAQSVLNGAGNSDCLSVEETIVHASVDDSRETRLREWLTNWLDRQASFDVKIRQRRPRPLRLHCRHCDSVTESCISCKEPLATSVEKGVDAALVTDLLSLAWQDAYDVAVLVSGDADYIPAVEYVQSQGRKVINAGWRGTGHNLRNRCWGSFEIDAVVRELTRG